MKLAFSKAVLVAAGVALFAGSLLNAEDKFSPVIVIHGGTSGLELTKDEFKVREEPMKKALLAGQAVLEKGGSAMDAVTAAIMVLELKKQAQLRWQGISKIRSLAREL